MVAHWLSSIVVNTHQPDHMLEALFLLDDAAYFAKVTDQIARQGHIDNVTRMNNNDRLGMIKCEYTNNRRRYYQSY